MGATTAGDAHVTLKILDGFDYLLADEQLTLLSIEDDDEKSEVLEWNQITSSIVR